MRVPYISPLFFNVKIKKKMAQSWLSGAVSEAQVEAAGTRAKYRDITAPWLTEFWGEN